MSMRLRPYTFLCLVPLFAMTALADIADRPARVDVFITSTTNVTGLEWLEQQLPDVAIGIHRIDGIDRTEAMLGNELPGNADLAEQTALRRMQRFGTTERELLRHSADALLLAWRYQLRRYPAVVFDQCWVVYGVTDLSSACLLYTSPSPRDKF